MEQYNFNIPNVSPVFSYTLANIKTPTWYISTANYNTELTRLSKQSTSGYEYRQYFYKMVSEQYCNRRQFFTDGSKSGDCVGAAVVESTSSER